jgi:hypothetical protein
MSMSEFAVDLDSVSPVGRFECCSRVVVLTCYCSTASSTTCTNTC